MSLSANKILFIILLFGFILRILIITWGVPLSSYISCPNLNESCYESDEEKVYWSTINFPQIVFTTEQFMGYGTTVQYILGFLLTPVRMIIFLVLGQHYLYGIIAWLSNRFLSVVLGVATAYLGYYLSLKFFDKLTALLTAALISASPLHVGFSALANVDVAMGFLLALNFILCFKAIKNNSLKNYLMLGVASGLLMGTKITGAIFIVVPLLLNVLKKRLNLKNVYVYFLATYFCFFILNPHIFFNPLKYYQFIVREKIEWFDKVNYVITSLPKSWNGSINDAIGFPMATVAFLLGILLAKRKNWQYKLSLVVFVILYLLFWREMLWSKYVVPIIWIICLFEANFLAYLINKKNFILKYLGIGIFIVHLAFSLKHSFTNIYLRLNDTRTTAAKYIMKNISKGTTIGFASIVPINGWREHRWRYPRINLDFYKETDFLLKPDYIVTSSIDIDEIKPKLESDKLKRPEYIWDARFKADWYYDLIPSPDVFKFYDNLLYCQNDCNYVLEKVFKSEIGTGADFLPPEIRIYKKRTISL